MKILFSILVFVSVANCQRLLRAGITDEGILGEPAPEPYAFAFSSATEDGGVSTREETQDASGKVIGFYTIDLPDGSKRRVDYEADANGYRARVSTNELGTENNNPADVEMQSTALSAAEAAARYGSSYETSSRTSGAAGYVVRGGGSAGRTETITTTRRVTGSSGSVVVRPSAPATTTSTATTRIGEDGIEYVVVPVRRGSTLREAVNELGLPSEKSETVVLNKEEAQQIMSKHRKI